MQSSFRVRSLLAIAMFCAALSGCGSGAPAGTASSQASPAVSNLAGNWLLLGTIPQGPLSSATGTSLSVTFAIADDQISGSGTVDVFCQTSPQAGSGFGESFVLSGTVRPDGTFTATTPTLQSGLTALPITVTGTVPDKAQDAWTGQYTIDASAQGTCNPVLNGTFTASSIAPVNGTYTGTGTVGLGATATAASMSVTLQQPVSGQSSSPSGSITLSGVPCLHTGTLTPNPTTALPLAGNNAGDEFEANFKMDNGSQLLFVAYISDPAASTLKVQPLANFFSTCMGSPAPLLQFNTLTRQN